MFSLLVVGLVAWLALSHCHTAEESPYILKIGQTYATPQDFYKIFGIDAKDSLWGKRLPRHPRISVWAPQYHNIHWHNDGDPSQLLPVITEWWEPVEKKVDTEMLVMRNRDHYYACRDLNELRITFMNGLPPDTARFIFIGVYRMDFEQSNLQRVIWERVAETVDLSRLDYLEELHNKAP